MQDFKQYSLELPPLLSTQGLRTSLSGAFKHIKWSSFDSAEFTQFAALELQMFKLLIILITWGLLNHIDLEAEHNSLFLSLEHISI